jgi:hypothetical protein
VVEVKSIAPMIPAAHDMLGSPMPVRHIIALLSLGVIGVAIAIWATLGPNPEGKLADRPVTCSPGQQYWAIDLPAGHDVFECVEGNLWILTSKSPASTNRQLEGTREATDPTAEKIHALSEDARNCLGMYLKYGDTKMSDLTYSQARQIQFCDSRVLYHDLE